MGLFCFLRVNAISAAQDAWHERQGTVPLPPDTQHGFVSTKAGAGDGIKGQRLLGEFLGLFPGGQIVMVRGVKLLGRRAGKGMEPPVTPPISTVGWFWLWGDVRVMLENGTRGPGERRVTVGPRSPAGAHG